MGKNKIIDLVYDEATGAYVPGLEVETKEESTEPKKERAQRKNKKSFQETQESPFQNLMVPPNNPVGNVLHGIQTGLFVIDEVKKAINKIMR